MSPCAGIGYSRVCKTFECGFESHRILQFNFGITMEVFDTKEFKKAFWEWFDTLPKLERKKFQEYPADMAELYFYNKIWSRSSTE